MNTLVFVVKGQMITRTDNLLPVAKCRNLYRAKFDFKNANWDGIKTALFKMGNKPKAVILDENDECDIPWEFFDTEETAYGTVSVFCGDLVTANKESVLVMQSGYEQSEASEPPTPDIYNQILEVVDDTKQIAQSVRDDADKGLFNGKDGDDGKSAYEIAVSLGFVGTEQQWIDSLRYDHSDEFAQLTEQVRQALETEGNRQNNALVEMGTEQKEAITNEGTLQKKSVTDAGEEQVEFITEEGNKQKKAVEDEGTKQLEAVNKAVEGIVADREQITQNKEDITTLKEEATALDNTKADGIIETASGEIIKTEISSDSKLTGLKVFGKSEQVATTGKNLLPTTMYSGSLVRNGVTFINNGDGSVTASGTATDTTYFTLWGYNQLGDKGVLQGIAPGDVLYISDCLLQQTNSEKVISNVSNRSTIFRDSTTTMFVAIRVAKGESVNKTFYPQIEKGSEFTSYESYTGGKPSPSPDYPQPIKSAGDNGEIVVNVDGVNLLPCEPYKIPHTLIIPTSKGLTGIPVTSNGNYSDKNGQQWICDEIDLARGKYIQRIWKKTFDGSEDWKLYLSKGYEGFYLNALPEIMNNRKMYCNIYQIYNDGSTARKEGILMGANNYNIYAAMNRFYDSLLEDKGLANWKAFLAQNPMEIVTYITTPIETDLPPEVIEQYSHIHTYYPTTVISNDENAGMEVSYVADTKNYINQKIDTINAVLVNIQKALL